MTEEIRSSNAVALHVRWFNAPGSATSHNLSLDYYQRAIALIEKQIDSPRYFLFSDSPEAARAALALPEGKVRLFHTTRVMSMHSRPMADVSVPTLYYRKQHLQLVGSLVRKSGGKSCTYP